MVCPGTELWVLRMGGSGRSSPGLHAVSHRSCRQRLDQQRLRSAVVDVARERGGSRPSRSLCGPVGPRVPAAHEGLLLGEPAVCFLLEHS